MGKEAERWLRLGRAEIVERLKASSIDGFSQCTDCGGMHPKTKDGKCSPCRIIQRQATEIERLEQEIKQLETKLIDYNPYLKMVKRQAAVVEAAQKALKYLDNEPMTGAFEYARQAQAILREALAKLDGGGE